MASGVLAVTYRSSTSSSVTRRWSWTIVRRKAAIFSRLGPGGAANSTSRLTRQRLDRLGRNVAAVLGLLRPLPQHRQQLAYPANHHLTDGLAHLMPSDRP